MTTPSKEDIERLAAAVHVLMRELLVVGRAGQPAEGKIPFNPLYFHILGLLREHKTARPSELAESLGVARTTLSTATRALAGRGLISQSKDPEDGRAQIVSLTEEGRKTVAAIRRQDQKNMKLLIELVPESDRASTITVLEQLANRLSKE